LSKWFNPDSYILQPTLERLPALALAADAQFENNFMEPVAALEAAAGSAPAPAAQSSDPGDAGSRKSAKPPCPVDLLVPPQAAVVMVTGGSITAIASSHMSVVCVVLQLSFRGTRAQHQRKNVCLSGWPRSLPKLLCICVARQSRHRAKNNRKQTQMQFRYAAGPNTGGKTASLMAQDLAALLLKAGCFYFNILVSLGQSQSVLNRPQYGRQDGIVESAGSGSTDAQGRPVPAARGAGRRRPAQQSTAASAVVRQGAPQRDAICSTLTLSGDLACS